MCVVGWVDRGMSACVSVCLGACVCNTQIRHVSSVNRILLGKNNFKMFSELHIGTTLYLKNEKINVLLTSFVYHVGMCAFL